MLQTAPIKVNIAGKVQNVHKVNPRGQGYQSSHLPTVQTYTFSNAPSNLLTNSGAAYKAVLPKGTFTKLGHLVLKISVTVASSSVTLAAVPHWFKSINVRSNSDNTILATRYDETALFDLFAHMSTNQKKALCKNINIAADEANYLGAANALAPGIHTFYYPLSQGSALQNTSHIRWDDAQSDLSFELIPESTGPVISGSGTVSLSGLQLMCEAQRWDAQAQAEWLQEVKLYGPGPRSNIHLDPVVTDFDSKQMNAGSTTYFDLQNVQGKAAFALVTVKPTGQTNSGNGYMKLLNVGDDAGATIDLVDTGNQSMLGHGQAIPTKFLRNEISIHHFNSNFIAAKPFYVVPFCDSIKGSYAGQIDGFQQFDGQKLQLAITLPTAPTAEVQTVTCSAAANAGFYRFAFRGEFSEPLAHSASVSAMKAAFEAMKQVRRCNITVTFSATAANTSFTATFVHPESHGLEGDKIEIVESSLNNSGAAVNATSVITTAGTSGLVSGQYDVRVYSYLFKELSYIGGRLVSNLL